MNMDLATKNTTVFYTYQELLSDITKIYEDAKDSTLIAVNKIRNHAYWLIGERIVEVEQGGSIRAQYGTELLESISRDMSIRFPEGFSATNLRNMRKFYLTHQKQQPAAELSWSHHQLLLKIKDEKKRELYEKKSIDESWSKRALRSALVHDRIEIDRSDSHANQIEAMEEIPQLPVQRGILSHYRLLDIRNFKDNSIRLMLDCGFNIIKDISLDSSFLFQPNHIVKIDSTPTGLHLKKTDLTRRDIYTYKAWVDHVSDGDTVVVLIDCGFGFLVKQRLRLRNIDCAPVNTKLGKKAKNLVTQILKELDLVVIKTYHRDKYDRYLADIFTLPGQRDATTIACEGHLLNQALLNEKLATVF